MKVAHIISHSHWDREWYMPYENHHMRLIKLIDQVLEAIDNDSNFKSFHLDGQTICIDDYLQVKPQNREKLLNAIKDGKIKIGPWYILQDAFLTSAEANVRNGYYGDIDCSRYGLKTNVGYYPDTFGIYSQAPQLMKELEIDNMIFGRGVTTTGFNNEVSNNFESKFSEMNIKSSDGSEVLGILFANWYSNANEIPVDKESAKEFWDKKLKECEQYTGLNHLLFMNGCDHTPYQENVTKAIEVANELYPDIKFVHSSFEEYLKCINEEIETENLTTISGELTSQRTDGMYTLVNTASSRINQKINNAEIQSMYENIVEPLTSLYSDVYPHSEIEYGWKKLMQNHPHDSICGCSVDSVHSSMDARFEDSRNVANHIISETLNKLENQISCDGKLAFTIINPSEITNTKHSAIIEYAREEFGRNYNIAKQKMKEITVPNLKLIDENGCEIEAKITDLGLNFDYYLPDDKFRRPYFSRNIKVDFNYKFDFIGHKTFYLVEADKVEKINTREYSVLENDFVKVNIEDNGSFSIYNKKTKRSQKSLLNIYDQGDIGNEYMFGKVEDDKEIFLSQLKSVECLDTCSMQVTRLHLTMDVPKGADDYLKEEQLNLVGYNNRKSKRTSESISVPITIDYTLDEFDAGLKLNIKIKNTAKNHRMRARFNLEECKDIHYADSVFEIVSRKNIPEETWRNSSFDHRMAKFIRIENQKDGLTIGTNGLHEYEVKDSYVDITLLRAVGELGDWGHFPTPEAQCLETVNAQMYVCFDELENNNYHANLMRTIFVSQPIVQVYGVYGKLPSTKQMLDIEHDQNSYISSIKRSLEQKLIVRLGSNGTESLFTTSHQLSKTNFFERKTDKVQDKVVKANEILTLKIED